MQSLPFELRMRIFALSLADAKLQYMQKVKRRLARTYSPRKLLAAHQEQEFFEYHTAYDHGSTEMHILVGIDYIWFTFQRGDHVHLQYSFDCQTHTRYLHIKDSHVSAPTNMYYLMRQADDGSALQFV